MIPIGQHSYSTQSLDDIETYYCRTDTFKKFFFPNTVVEWKTLDLAGPILESKGMHEIFQKKDKTRAKKGNIFENLGKNVQNLKIF